MKTSIKKLLRRRHRKQDRKIPHSLSKLDELALASQDMQDMRECYDSLLSAAAAATNSAYEFSESLQEMGVCLLQKIVLNEDEETGKVMMMLGKVQFELQKLVDTYRAHIFQTITVPSESLINEIHTLEEMKHQCDEKRQLYEYMRLKCGEKGRSKSEKEEGFSVQQLRSAKDEFDEEATLFIFRLKSLKQGQSRSLLTQTARHHAAQLTFFRKGLKALEMVEPHVELVTQQQHIDYQFSGLDDKSEGSEGDDDDGDESDSVYSASSVSSGGENGQLIFDYRRNDRQRSFVSAVRNATEENAKVGGGHEESFTQQRKMLSQSAPLFPRQKFDPARMRQLQPSVSRKFHSYALPKPGDPRISISAGVETPLSKNEPSPQRVLNLYHSCPLEPKKSEKLEGIEHSSGTNILNPDAARRERNKHRMPPPLTEEVSMPHLHPHAMSSTKKLKLQSFSGPIPSKPLSTKPSFSAEKIYKERPPFSSPKGSPLASATFSSSPRISELHELPRPPTNLIYNSGRPPGFTGFSAPLMGGSPEYPMTNKMFVPKITSSLPNAPLNAHTAMPSTSPKVAPGSDPFWPSEASPAPSSEKSEIIASPPLAPVLRTNQHPT